MSTLTSDQIMKATDDLVAAFAATDTSSYFACFSPAATFVFHAEPIRLNDRAAYEALRRGSTTAGEWCRARTPFFSPADA